MSWINETVTVDETRRIVRDAVRFRQHIGLKTEHAFEDVAEAYGTTARRVRSLFRGELVKVLRQEFRALMEKRWSDLRRQAADLRARADELDRIEQKERAALAREMSCTTLSSGSSGGSLPGDMPAC